MLGKYLTAEQLRAHADELGRLREHLRVEHGCDGLVEPDGHLVSHTPPDLDDHWPQIGTDISDSTWLECGGCGWSEIDPKSRGSFMEHLPR